MALSVRVDSQSGYLEVESGQLDWYRHNDVSISLIQHSDQQQAREFHLTFQKKSDVRCV